MREGIARRALVLAAGCAVTLAAAAPAGAVTAARAPADNEWLYLQKAGHATLRPIAGSRSLKLTLERPSADVRAFTDRPSRTFRVQPLRAFLGGWHTYGFDHRAPNAAIEVSGAGPRHDVLIVKLSAPDRSSGGVSYTARPVRDANRIDDLASFARRADAGLPRHLGATSVYIDDAADAVAQVQIQFTGVIDTEFSLSQPTFQGMDTGDAPVQFGAQGSSAQVAANDSNASADIGFTANPLGSCVVISVDTQVTGPGFSLVGSAGNGPNVNLANGTDELPLGSNTCPSG